MDDNTEMLNFKSKTQRVGLKDCCLKARPGARSVVHVDVDHGIPMEVLEQMYLGVSPSGTKTWKLPPARWLFDVWEKSGFRL